MSRRPSILGPSQGRTRPTQSSLANLKLDRLRADRTVDEAIGRLWALPKRDHRAAQNSRMSAFEAYITEYMRTQTDDDARSSLSPTPPRYSPPPFYNATRRVTRRKRPQAHRMWYWERKTTGQQQADDRVQKPQISKSFLEERQHGMVTRSRTSTRTRFYRLRVPP